MSKSMRAVLLAGGKGTRLYPYTAVFPKPLVPIGDRPVLEILIHQLKFYGFTEITLCVGHLADLLVVYFGDGSKFGVKINYSFEEKPLGTIGPLRLLKDLPETFLVANGDLLVDTNFREIWNKHNKSKALLTIGTKERNEKIDLGVLETQKDQVVSFKEKPEFTFKVSAGIYIFSKKILNYIPRDSYFDFPGLVQKLLKKNQKICSYNIPGFWLDIGRPDDYQKAIDKFNNGDETFSKYFH